MSAPNWWGDWRPILTPHTGNLQPTDLLECTSIVGGLPVNTAITGAQIIAAASGGSGLTVGTTAITSGTIGRVLFEGTGNVLQQSANLFWDNTNNRLGIGTSSPSFPLDVNGTARVQTSLAVTTGKTFSAYTSSAANDALKLEVSNLGAVFGVQNSNASGFSGIEYLSNAGVPRVFTGFNNGNGQEFRFNNFASGGYIDFLISSTSALRIANTRNILINTTTDAGFRLDVNGTARVSGTINVTQVSGNVFRLTNNTYFHSTAGGVQTIDYYNGFVFQNAGQVNIKASFSGNIRFLRESIFGTDGVNNASAQVQIDSTTKGFLPPRMTNAQMLAIATPAAGLVVYDTTNNKHCGYNGTAWQNFY
jgi:hypothetical protein